MTLPWDLQTSSYNVVVLTADGPTDQLPAPADVPPAGLHSYFADRADELHQSLQAVRAEFDAVLEERLVETEEFRRLGEMAHEQAEEVDALLLLLVRGNVPAELIQEAETTFDSLRDLEQQIAEALEWNNRMGRRLVRL